MHELVHIPEVTVTCSRNTLYCKRNVDNGNSFNLLIFFRVISRCPIEDGVIQTNWGTISPGTLVAAIAASLESQRVPVTEILNANIFKEDIAEPLMVSAKQEWFEDIETLQPRLDTQRQSDVADIGNIWVATLAGRYFH